MSEFAVLSLVSFGLLVLNIFQFVYWGWQTQKLIDKLMCRDLAEYKLVTDGPKERPAKEFNEYEDEIEEQEILAELNGAIARR